VIRKPDLGESRTLRGLHILDRLAHGMMAELGMDVVVGPDCDHAKIFLRQTKTGDEPTENLANKRGMAQ
jgi:hypothetical protein